MRFGPIGPHCIHLCVDMQRLFGPDTEWNTPWIGHVLPMVSQICRAHPDRTIFTRFITPKRPDGATGAWQRYYRHWHSVTTSELASEVLDLLEPLRRFVPPAAVLDKTTYSPWIGAELADALGARGADTVVVTGGETDVCVLGTVLGAVDRGLRAIVVTDALCSPSETAHETMMSLFRDRYDLQIELVTTAELLEAWV